MTLHSRVRLQAGELTFIVVFFVWLVGGIFSALVKISSFAERYTGYVVDYGNLWTVLPDYVIFLLTFFMSIWLIRIRASPSLRLEQTAFSFWVAFIIYLLSAFLKLSYSGVVLLSGDYYARFESEANLLVNIGPSVVALVVIELHSRFFRVGDRNWQWFVVACLAIAGLASLSGSRTTVFYVTTALLTRWVLDKNVRDPNFLGSVRQRLKVIAFVAKWIVIIYFAGQAFNIIRWFGFDISFDRAMVATLGDFFPEYRSHSFARDYVENYQISFGLIPWLINLSGYIFPGFVFELFGYSRTELFNSVWKIFFEPIFWGGGESLFGVRTGLVGEVSLALGRWAIVPFGLLYAFIFRRLRFKILVAGCMCGTIPYGATSIFLLFYCYLFFAIIVIFTKIMTSRLN